MSRQCRTSQRIGLSHLAGIDCLWCRQQMIRTHLARNWLPPSSRSFFRANAAAEISSPLAAWSEDWRSEEHTSELQSLMSTSYAVFCLKKKKQNNITILSIQSHTTQT